MKLKYYLKGLGTGILFATMILSIAFTVYDNAADKKSEDDIIAAAIAAGMVWPDKEKVTEESTPEPATSVESMSEQPTQEPSAPDEPTTSVESTSEQPTQEPSAPDEPTTQEQTTPAETMPEQSVSDSTVTTEDNGRWTLDNGIVTLTIVSGMNSGDVAKLLYEAGLVSGYRDFDNYLMSKGYGGKINVGDFKITVGASYDEIIKIICRLK